MYCLCIHHCSPRYFLKTMHYCLILQNLKKRILIHLRDYKTVAKIICVLSLKSCDKTYGSLKKVLFTFHMLKNILIAMLTRDFQLSQFDLSLTYLYRKINVHVYHASWLFFQFNSFMLTPKHLFRLTYFFTQYLQTK